MHVGVTGHRPNRLHIGEGRIALRLRDVLGALKDGAGPQHVRAPLIAASSLAEGADRLFAEIALDLRYELRVLLPMPTAKYEKTFADRATTAVYRALLAEASVVTQLPGSLTDPEAAFDAVGQAMVDTSDVLIAIWDGKPSAGVGGTADIIAYAVARLRPVLWIDASADRRPLLLRLPRRDGQPIDLPASVLGARSQSPADVRALAARTTSKAAI